MNNNATRKILVPCDFKEESKVALSHALQLANYTEADVVLLHLVNQDGDLATAEGNMQNLKLFAQENFSKEVATIVENRKLIEGIGEVASREACDLIVMATHGLRGWQHVTGSLALRVISESKVPCIIVQQREFRPTGYRRIVLPVQWRPQIMEEVSVIIQMAKKFSSEIFLLAINDGDSTNHLDLLDSIKSLFEQNNVAVQVEMENATVNAAHQTVRYAASVDADLICSVNYSYEYLYTLFPRAEEEDLIYNDAQIPVMLLTPEYQVNQCYVVPLWH